LIEFKHILVPTDFGDSAERALDVAVDLAKKYAASLTVVHVYEIPAYVYEGMMTSPVDLLTPIRETAERQLDSTLRDVRTRIPDTKGILGVGIPWQEIQKVIAETHPDLVVMGTHGRRGVSHVLLGSVAEKIVRLSPVPVLTVRANVTK
jgi:nucleotide-binding universal stress UspA family protein